MRINIAAIAIVFGLAAAFPRGRAAAQTLRVEVNVPSYTLDVLRGDTLVRSFRVAVGLRANQTPIGNYAITEITWNPSWRPPRSAWAKRDTAMPPGPENPMGVVKLLIGGLYYVHGTPLDASIGHAASHGCIRMHQADAVALASLILEDQQMLVPSWPADDPTPIAERTVELTLQHPVPVIARYATTAVHGRSVTFYPDVYRRGTGTRVDQAVRALGESGLDTTAVTRGRLASLLKRAAGRRITVPLSSIGLTP